MKVIVCKDEDAMMLLAEMRLKERELEDRFKQQNFEQQRASAETSRSLMYTLIVWLQAQGFTVTR